MIEEQLKKIERSRKPIKCPACGRKPVATILYGYPEYTEEFDRELNEGLISIGGCMMKIDAPVWECSFCGQKIHKISN